MQTKSKLTSNVVPLNPVRPVKKPVRPVKKSDYQNEEQRSLKANARSPVARTVPPGSTPSEPMGQGKSHILSLTKLRAELRQQRRAALETLDSKALEREGGVEWALTIIRASAARLRTLGTEQREEQHYTVAYCYGLAQHFVKHKPAWAAFCRDEFWHDYADRPKAADSSDALWFVLLWGIGTKGSAASKKVSRFHSAVRPFFDEGVPASEIPNKIKEGRGIANLATAHVKNPRRAPDDDSEKPEKPQRPEKKSASAAPAPHKGEGSSNSQKSPGLNATKKGAVSTVVLHADLEKRAQILPELSTPCLVHILARIESWNGNEAQVTILNTMEIGDGE